MDARHKAGHDELKERIARVSSSRGRRCGWRLRRPAM